MAVEDLTAAKLVLKALEPVDSRSI
jgi:hypothetical protein